MFRVASCFGVFVVLLGVGDVWGVPPAVYFNDFEGAVGPEWTHSLTDVTLVSGRRLLGQFSNDVVSLSLTDLPVHEEIGVSLDLFVIYSWDGNENREDWGPDHWALSVSGGPTLLDTTFSNDHPISRPFGQSFPDDWPAGSHPPFTGAAETNSLGYIFDAGSYGMLPMDSVYHLEFAFPHTADSLTLNFASWNLQGLGDENWGLDNVMLIPEPSTLLLLCMGAVGLGSCAWRRRKERVEACFTYLNPKGEAPGGSNEVLTGQAGIRHRGTRPVVAAPCPKIGYPRRRFSKGAFFWLTCCGSVSHFFRGQGVPVFVLG